MRPISRGWVVRDGVPGPDVDEFAEPERVVAALARARTGTLLAVQHPHRTPAALAAGESAVDALPRARAELARLRATAYREVRDVVAPYRVDGPDGTAWGLLCVADPAAVGHTEDVYPGVVAERARVLAGLGCATSAAMLVPVGRDVSLTGLVAEFDGEPAASVVDPGGRRHRLWLEGPGERQDALLAAAGEHPLMVADGNHRVAAAAGMPGLLALVTAGPDLRVGPIHRAVSGTGLTAARAAAAWRALGLAVTPVARGTRPSPGVVVAVAGDGAVAVPLPAGGVDHAFVESVLLAEALGLDPEGPHVRPVTDEAADADLLLLIAPVPPAEVLAVHAAGGRMPRKSTYFTPKPRSGLLLADLELPPGAGVTPRTRHNCGVDDRSRVEEDDPVAHGELRGVVALDGPSGTGKSSVARRLAATLGARYLDTGAMYRAVTLAVLRAGVDPADDDAVLAVVRRAEVVQAADPDRSTTHLDGEDVGTEIRGPEVTRAVSAVSAVPAVRELVVGQQRDIIAAALAEAGGIVVEGRDIGTVVVPDAALKVYITADAEARAQRRAKQDAASGRAVDPVAILADVRRRDAHDSSRAVSPLRAADDAVVLDTTSLDLAGVLAALLELVDARDLLAQPSGRVRR